MDLQVRHLTRYPYAPPVRLGPHRLMLRPRDSFDLRILRTGLVINPPAALNWLHDAYGNSVAMATFEGEAEELSIESELVLRRYQPTGPQPTQAPWRSGAPIAYSEAERQALIPFLNLATEDPSARLDGFAQQAAKAQSGQGHPLLELSAAIHHALSYQMRFEEGTQAPVDTLETGTGTCRDYAWLFIEAARRLGYAARFVTGYLHNVGAQGPTALTASVGYSHAWAEVYVPGDGWVEFDPTNLLVADRQLIRIAVTRTPQEASPVSGTFIGQPQTVQPIVSVEIAAVRDELFADVA